MDSEQLGRHCPGSRAGHEVVPHTNVGREAEISPTYLTKPCATPGPTLTKSGGAFF